MREYPIRVLHVVPNMNAGGLETLIMNIYRNIDRTKVQFDFLLHYEGEFFYSKEIRELGGKIYHTSVRDDSNLIKYFKDLNHFFKEHQEYRIIHGHMVSTAIFYLFYARKYRCEKRIIHSHNTNTIKGLKGTLKKILASFSTVFANEYFACGIMAGKSLFKDKTFHVVNNGIEIEKFRFNSKVREQVRKELKLSEFHLYGHVGRFNMQKNHAFLMKIFKEICKKDDLARLVLVGDGELKNQIFKMAEVLGIMDKIIYLGIRNDVNRLYQAMDLFILPSHFEGFPVVATECQAAGLPILVSNTVSDEIKIAPNVKFLSLDGNQEIWADCAIEMINEKRIDTADIVREAGYDIKDVASELQAFYLANW